MGIMQEDKGRTPLSKAKAAGRRLAEEKKVKVPWKNRKSDTQK
jgi:hypothetical protein